MILNGDDDKLSTIREVKGIVPRTFGLNPGNEIWADQLESRGLKGISCRIHTLEGDFDAAIPMPGEHMVYNALAAAAAGLYYGLTLEEIRRGIESFETIRGRFRILETGTYTLIDDCYNANPVSMKDLPPGPAGKGRAAGWRCWGTWENWEKMKKTSTGRWGPLRDPCPLTPCTARALSVSIWQREPGKPIQSWRSAGIPAGTGSWWN